MSSARKPEQGITFMCEILLQPAPCGGRLEIGEVRNHLRPAPRSVTCRARRHRDMPSERRPPVPFDTSRGERIRHCGSICSSEIGQIRRSANISKPSRTPLDVSCDCISSRAESLRVILASLREWRLRYSVRETPHFSRSWQGKCASRGGRDTATGEGVPEICAPVHTPGRPTGW